MKTLKELRAERKKKIEQMRAMVTTAENDGDREFTAEETTAYEALEAELKTLDAKIARASTLEAAEESLEEVRPAAARRSQQIPRPGGPEAAREFENIGEFMHAVRFRPNDQRLNFVEGVGAAEDDAELTAEMRMDNGPSGGFMVPNQLRSTLMSVAPQDVLVRPRAQVIEAGTPPDGGVTIPALDQDGSAPGNMFGGVQLNWIAEGEDEPDTDAKIKNISLVPKEVAGITTVTDKLLRNWQASSTFIESQLRGALNAGEDLAFIRGDGVARPLGVLNSGATQYVNRTNANSIVYDDLIAMVAKLLMRGGSSPVWSMPQGALPQIATLKDPANRYIWQASAKDGFAGQLLGYPLRWNNRMPALGSKGDVLIADWSYYLIKDGSGPFVAASEHVLFRQNKTVIKIFWNVDGAPWMKGPIQEENGYEVSPFISLDVPA